MEWMMRNSWVDPELLLCAKSDRKIVGQTFVLPRKVIVEGTSLQIGMVSQVAVKPHWRRRGVATMLMRKAAELARQKSYDGLLLIANPRSPAHTLYMRMGYRELARIRLRVRILNPKLVSRAFDSKYIIPILQLLSSRPSVPSEGVSVRSYRPDDKHEVLSLLRRYVKQCECTEEVDELYWIWKNETSLPEGFRKCFVAERSGRVVAFISAVLMTLLPRGIHQKKPIHVYLLEDLCFEDSMSMYLRTFLSEVLKQLGPFDPLAAVHLAYPNEDRLWKTLGFLGIPFYTMVTMCYPLKPSFQVVTQATSFYLSRF